MIKTYLIYIYLQQYQIPGLRVRRNPFHYPHIGTIHTKYQIIKYIWFQLIIYHTKAFPDRKCNSKCYICIYNSSNSSHTNIYYCLQEFLKSETFFLFVIEIGVFFYTVVKIIYCIFLVVFICSFTEHIV